MESGLVTHGRAPRQVAATEFRARFFALLDEVRDQRVEVIITKRGKLVAKLVPIESHGRPSLAHIVRYMGDVESPIDEEWEVLSGNPRWPWWEETESGPPDSPLSNAWFGAQRSAPGLFRDRGRKGKTS